MDRRSFLGVLGAGALSRFNFKEEHISGKVDKQPINHDLYGIVESDWAEPQDIMFPKDGYIGLKDGRSLGVEQWDIHMAAGEVVTVKARCFVIFPDERDSTAFEDYSPPTGPVPLDRGRRLILNNWAAEIGLVQTMTVCFEACIMVPNDGRPAFRRSSS